MNHNSINVTIPSTDLEQLKVVLQGFTDMISPFLMPQVLPELMSGLAKLGDKSESFVQRALVHAQKEPKLIPGFASLEHAQKDYKLFQDLKVIQDNLEKLYTMVSQTRILAGAEALDFANDFYKYTGVVAKSNNPAAMVVFEDLKSRYKKNPVKKLQSKNQ